MKPEVDSIVAKAIAALDSFSVKLRNFIMLVRNSDVVACVFEGEDHLYYNSRIDAHMPGGKRRVNFPVHGKANVLKLYALRLTNSYVREANSLYFVDKDFDLDRICNRSQLYMTPCYSIENFYVTRSTISRIIRDCFKVEEYKIVSGELVVCDEYSRITNYIYQFIDSLQTEYVFPLNAYILAGKKALRNGKAIEKDQFVYKNFSFSEYVDISFKRINKKKEINFINLTISLNAGGLISEEEFEKELGQLKQSGRVMDLRGKNNFEIFSLVMRNVFEDAGKSVPKIFSKKKDDKISFNLQTALGDLSSFADTPLCLREFLQSELAII